MDKNTVLEDLKIEVEELEEKVAPFWYSEWWAF